MKNKVVFTFCMLLSSFSFVANASNNGGSSDGICSGYQKPTIFVHGWNDDSRAWDTMINRYASAGYSRCTMFRFGYNSARYSNKYSARLLRNYVDNVRRANGYKKVNIIAHSNGGLVTRWYRVYEGGYYANNRFISAGTPHAGTSSAYLCSDPACYEMRPGSSFLRSLNGRGCDRSVWSPTDGIINPSSSAAACGWTYRTIGMGHSGLLWRNEVFNIMRPMTPKY